MSSRDVEKLRAFIHEVMKCHNVPGVSLAVTHQGQTILCEGFGTKDLASNSNVTESTKFCIGSITKSFTAALIASLLPQYGYNWNTPLNRIFGNQQFQFSDAYMTEKACMRDLLAHKMGIELGETDFGWICSSLKSNQIPGRVQHLPLSPLGFRSALFYNNYMYAMAGEAVEKMTTQRWEDLIRERFFELLGMQDAGFVSDEETFTEDIAKPHLSVGGNPVEIDTKIHRGCRMCIGPAGSVCCSARDMIMWMTFLLNEGKIGDLPIIPKAQLQECWKPQVALPCGKPEWDGYAFQPQFPVTESRDTYGFGWYRGTYRGFKMLAHGGELVGYDSLITLFPDADLGIYTAFNGPGGEHAYIGNQLIHYFVSDCLLGLEEWLTKDNVSKFPEPWLPKQRYFIPRINTDIIKGINSTRPLRDYAGSYRHGFLGDVFVRVDADADVLNMSLGENGQFKLYPNGEIDEFRLEGTGALSFLHKVDMFAPSDWMTVRFCSFDSALVDACIISLFESGPVFKRVELIM